LKVEVVSLAALDETVLVVRKNLLTRQIKIPASGFDGASPLLLQHIARKGFFVTRRQAEQCTDWKQIILYLVLRYRRSLFVYQRVRATTETRLMHMHSIGLGGHINPVTGSDGHQLFSANLHRELTEEVRFSGHFSYRPIGIVNDDQSEVGKYHLGLVYLVSCATPEISVRETDKLAGSLLPISEAASYLSAMETWSALIFPEVHRLLGSQQTGDR
jgi:predicted NUDIX family phosphoesterase